MLKADLADVRAVEDRVDPPARPVRPAAARSAVSAVHASTTAGGCPSLSAPVSTAVTGIMASGPSASSPLSGAVTGMRRMPARARITLIAGRYGSRWSRGGTRSVRVR